METSWTGMHNTTCPNSTPTFHGEWTLPTPSKQSSILGAHISQNPGKIFKNLNLSIYRRYLLYTIQNNRVLGKMCSHTANKKVRRGDPLSQAERGVGLNNQYVNSLGGLDRITHPHST